MTIESLVSFFGWCSVINIGFVILVVLATSVFDKSGFTFEFASKIFGVSKKEVRETLRVMA